MYAALAPVTSDSLHSLGSSCRFVNPSTQFLLASPSPSLFQYNCYRQCISLDLQSTRSITPHPRSTDTQAVENQAHSLPSAQTTPRTRDLGGGRYTVKRGHIPQLSISDDNHHVTEAIGDMYGDHHYGKYDPRPLSYMSSPPRTPNEQPSQSARLEPSITFTPRTPLTRTISNERLPPQLNGQGKMMSGRSNSYGLENGPLSPPLAMQDRSPSDTANSQFPLNDLDYESDPAAVAQELSNLQALRRMSMDVNPAGDPDLPTFNSNFGMPTAAPTGEADEDDTSRLFWVPARLHPELAPKEFKTFLDSRVDSIKRRSGESSLSPENSQRQGSSSLRRKKSMLSRQIDNSGGRGADGYTDGAEVLDRKRSLSGQETLNVGISNLQELEVLVNDPAKAIQKLSIDTEQHAVGGEVPASEDMPILPAAPVSNSLRRSTRTTYRRGSLKKGERVPFSRRAAKAAETDTEDSPSSPMTPAGEILSLSRVQTEPSIVNDKAPENFSRPGRLNRARIVPLANPAVAPTNGIPPPQSSTETRERPRSPPRPKPFVSQIASNGRSSISPTTLGRPVPQIIETPPPPDLTKVAPPILKPSHLPERSSSHEPPPSLPPQAPLINGPPSIRGAKWPPPARQIQGEKGNQTLKDMAAHPSPLPGNSTRTDSLSFIPTLTEDKKVDNRKPKDRRDKDANDGPRKSSWSWGSLLGNEEKEKEKKREEDAKKVKSKLAKPPDKAHDNTRLDVLQTTMEGSRGRESIVLDRGDVKLEEERKKESARKTSGGDGKKDKDPGLFSSLFGGGKKKGERESAGKKHFARNLSPDPPQRILKPDVDYSWTRFSILEERAIYRMAHIKLANPRRALHSQVLLSNFMYSYLAKVQQMHPQIQIPQSAAQKQQQAQQRKAEQPEEFSQYQKYQEVNSPLNRIMT